MKHCLDGVLAAVKVQQGRQKCPVVGIVVI